MAGMGADNVAEFAAALGGEDELRPFLAGVSEELKDVTGDEIASSMETLLPDVDKAALTGEFAEDMAASFREALRTGVSGWLDDDLAFTRPPRTLKMEQAICRSA
jgi:hypothetical protein